MATTGRLSGPEVVCPGGLAYRAGDRVVTLAPGPDGSLVTSQRATVEAVDPQAGAIACLRTDDGRLVRLAGEEASAERLGYGYATTVHRSQGATVARAHLFADGGGRELAYVAMSRARQSTHIWAVADDLAQAVEDLRRDWTIRRSPTWAIDTGQPIQTEQPEQARLAIGPRVKSDRWPCPGPKPASPWPRSRKSGDPDLQEAVETARMDLQQAKAARADLDTGGGVYHQTETGRAVRDLHSRPSRRRAGPLGSRTRPPLAGTPSRQPNKPPPGPNGRPTPASGSRRTWRPKPPVWTPTSSGARRPSPRSSPGPKSSKSPTGPPSTRCSNAAMRCRDLSRVVRAYQDHLDGIQPRTPRPRARTIEPRPYVTISPPGPTPQAPHPGISM